MGRTGTKKLRLKQDNFELDLEREESGAWRGVGDSSFNYTEDNLRHPHGDMKADLALSRGGEMLSRVISDTPKEDVTSTFITSPMVGTFYLSPSPEDPTFVKVGDKVDKNFVVCIIEAMKVMNEIKAGLAGTVVEILVDSGQPVEFGTKLFRVV